MLSIWAVSLQANSWLSCFLPLPCSLSLSSLLFLWSSLSSKFTNLGHAYLASALSRCAGNFIWPIRIILEARLHSIVFLCIRGCLQNSKNLEGQAINIWIQGARPCHNNFALKTINGDHISISNSQFKWSEAVNPPSLILTGSEEQAVSAQGYRTLLVLAKRHVPCCPGWESLLCYRRAKNGKKSKIWTQCPHFHMVTHSLCKLAYHMSINYTDTAAKEEALTLIRLYTKQFLSLIGTINS